MRKESYVVRYALEHDPSVLNDGLNEIGDDFMKLLNKYNVADLPLVLASVEMALPGLRKMIGDSGCHILDEIKAHTMTVMGVREAGDENE